MKQLYLVSFILGGFGVITNLTIAMSDGVHPNLGKSLQKHPFLGEAPDIQYKPFESE